MHVKRKSIEIFNFAKGSFKVIPHYKEVLIMKSLKSEKIEIRLTSSEKNFIKKMSMLEGLSMSAYLVRLAYKAYQQHELEKGLEAVSDSDFIV